jgi:RNA polymerase-binding transcription factor DksA
MSSSTLPGSTLTTAELVALRAQLEMQRDFRVEQLAQLQVEDAQPGRFAVDQEILEALLAGARGALHDIDEALRRIEDGSYGRCPQCGEPHALQQLQLLPQLARCSDCRAQRPG